MDATLETDKLKSLLAISWCMPPFLSPRSIQVSRLLTAIAAKGWQIAVLTQFHNNGSGKTLSQQVTAGNSEAYRTIRIPGPERHVIYRLWQQLLPSAFHIPDRHKGWILPAVQAGLEYIRHHPVRCLVSFAQPVSSHIVGLHLHRETGIPWIAHFSDPWVDSPYYKPANRRHDRAMRRMEQMIITEANGIIFSTQKTQQLVMRKYSPIYKIWSYVLPHGYDPEAFNIDPAPIKRPEQFDIVHTGRFYKTLRTPEKLLAALHFLKQSGHLPNDLHIHLAGEMPLRYKKMIRHYHLQDTVIYYGELEYHFSQQLAAMADLLLLVDTTGPAGRVFLPSKLIDYLPHQKPILGLTHPDSPGAELLYKLKCPVVPADDQFAIAAKLIKLREEWKQGKLKVTAAFKKHGRNYDIHRVSQRFEHIIYQVIEQHQLVPEAAHA